jgi:predicted DNA-binding protein with PD1-like motif
MRHKLLEEHPRTYILVFDTGDELASELKRFASDHNIPGASFKAIGALSSVKLGWFNWQTKRYETCVALEEQVELLSLIGDVAEDQGEPKVHAHVVLGKSDGTAHGGHLQEAVVRPTCELVITESPVHLRKRMDAESGIPLIRL